MKDKRKRTHTQQKYQKYQKWTLFFFGQTNKRREERDLSRQKTTHNKDTPTHLQQQNRYQQWEKNRERRKRERKGRTNQIASN
jgi:hypothetical protein